MYRSTRCSASDLQKPHTHAADWWHTSASLRIGKTPLLFSSHLPLRIFTFLDCCNTLTMSACIRCRDLEHTPLHILISQLRTSSEGCSSCQLLWNATTAIVGPRWDEYYHHLYLPPRSEEDAGPLRVELDTASYSTCRPRKVVYQICRKEGSCRFLNLFESCSNNHLRKH
jgi:hypothetical protein